MSFKIPLHVFPLGVAIFVPSCCIVPYILAVFYNHVTPILPYVSDAGGKIPESSLFSTLMDIASVFISITIFIRYKQIQVFLLKTNNTTSNSSSSALPSTSPTSSIMPCSSTIRLLTKVNKISFPIGLLMPIGAIIIGNYRMPEILAVHATGAIISFSGGIVYLSIQGWISYKLSPAMNSLQMAATRLAIAVFSLISYNISGAAAIISFYQYKSIPENDVRLHWSSDLPGYNWHIISAAAEWIMIFTTIPYFATFISEFKQLSWKELTQSYSNRNHYKQNQQIHLNQGNGITGSSFPRNASNSPSNGDKSNNNGVTSITYNTIQIA